MTDLNKEAKEYSVRNDVAGWLYNAFIAGANSKYVQSERIKAQLECLNKAKDLDIQTVYRDLQKQLEDLCNQ